MSEPTLPNLVIAPFQAAHQSGVLDLIVGIQRREYGLAITAADQPDLTDIPGFYQQGAGNFWVATVDDQVIGTIALREYAAGQGALRKMFVDAAYRGRVGVAGRLLATLLAWARERRIDTITLGTTERFLAAHRFYEKHGFVPIAVESLPADFPRMAVDTRFYALTLNAAAPVIGVWGMDEIDARETELVSLLQRCVADGASIGFMDPLSARDASSYWQRVGRAVQAGDLRLWAAEADGRLVGSVQLALEHRANGRHRAEVAKLMVDPVARRRGIGRALMQVLEAEARALGRSTLVLDTRAGDPSERLYGGLGYHRVGEIPNYALSTDGVLHSTAIYFKLLEP